MQTGTFIKLKAPTVMGPVERIVCSWRRLSGSTLIGQQMFLPRQRHRAGILIMPPSGPSMSIPISIGMPNSLTKWKLLEL